MFKFGHIADLHFGRSKHSSLDAKTGMQTALVNDVVAFNEFVEIAIREKVDALLIAGDVFDKIHVSNAVRREVAKAIRHVLDHMELYVIIGTHDRAHDKYAAHTLSDWMHFSGGTEHMARFHVIDTPSSFLHMCDGKPLANILAIPEPNKGALEDPVTCVRKSYTDHVKEAFAQFDIREDLPVVLIAHFAISGAASGEEVFSIAAAKLHEAVPVELFDSMPYLDYVAMGHIHMTQELGKTGKVVYPGSLNYNSFSEATLKKGGYICSISDDKVLTKKFVELKTPVPMQELRIDVRNSLTPMEDIAQQIRTADIAGKVVKVVYKIGEDNVKLVDRSELSKLLSSAVSHRHEPDVERRARVRNSEMTTKTSELQAMQDYLAMKECDAEIRKELEETFQGILRERQEMQNLDAKLV